LLKEGYEKRVEMASSGKDFRKSKDEEKSKLEAERLRLETIKQEKQRVKEEVEIPEKEALDTYRQIEEEKQRKLQEEEDYKTANEAENMFILLDSNDDGKISKDEIKSRQTFDKNKDGEVSDDEALFFLNMEEEMSKEDFLASGWLIAKPFFLMEQGMFLPPEDHKDSTEDPSLLSGGQPITEEPPLRELTEEEIQAKASRAEEDKENIQGVEEEEEELEEELEGSNEDHKAEDQPVEESKYDEATQKLIDGNSKKILKILIYILKCFF
jgi:protein kinase C substrate 80K-H